MDELSFHLGWCCSDALFVSHSVARSIWAAHQFKTTRPLTIGSAEARDLTVNQLSARLAAWQRAEHAENEYVTEWWLQ